MFIKKLNLIKYTVKNFHELCEYYEILKQNKDWNW